MTIIDQKGQGRPTAIFFESGIYAAIASELFKALPSDSRTLLVELPRITDTNWVEVTEATRATLSAAQVRQVSIMAFGGAASIAQNFYLDEPKGVRRMILIDAATRPHPSRFTRIIDRVEGFLPLGLPLRLRTEGFDSKSSLQKIRCPVMVVVTHRADAYHQGEGRVIAEGCPTAWRFLLPESAEVPGLVELARTFGDVPAKCPQKANRVGLVSSSVG